MYKTISGFTILVLAFMSNSIVFAATGGELLNLKMIF